MAFRSVSARRRVPAALACGLVAGLAAACGQPAPHRTPSPVPTPSPTATATPAPAQLKPVLSGLLDRTGIPPAAFYGALAGYVVNVNWSDLEPAPDGPLATGNAIDQAIAQVRSINAAAHTSLALKIRLYAGVDAPAWAKSLGGAPVTVTDPQSGGTGTVGRFWTSAFGAAYAHLQALLAAKYDSVPEVREVTISRCTTVFAEPMIRDTSDPSSVQALLAAGYTVQADEQCQQQEVQAHAVWHHTHSDLSLNPYQVIDADGTTGVDEAFTESMMQYCRQVLGPACVLENNSLRTSLNGTYLQMYAAMQREGPPIAIQTATSARVGNLLSALQYAASIGANSVELPEGFESTPPAQFTAPKEALAANPA